MPRKKIDESSPLYSFADKLKALRDKKGYTNQQLKKAIEEKLGYDFSEATLNNWLQHFAFPEYEKLVAICKVFPPYSVDYFMGVIEDKPSYDLAFIEEYTGLSCEAIEHLKKLSNSFYPENLSSFLISDTFTSLIKNIWEMHMQERDVNMYVNDAFSSIDDFISIYKWAIDNDYSQESMNAAINELFYTINSLSDENIKDMPSALLIERKRRKAVELIDDYFDNAKIATSRYSDLIELFNTHILPITKTDKYTKEYYEKNLKPIYHYSDKTAHLDMEKMLKDLKEKFGDDVAIVLGKPNDDILQDKKEGITND